MNAYVYILGLMLAGALLGALLALRRGGRLLDILQYAGVHMILGAILGLFLTIILGRMS